MRNPSDTRPRMLRLILAAEHGIQTKEICKRMGIGKSVAYVHARALAQAGLIGRTDQGCESRWCAPATAEKLNAEYSLAALKRERRRQKWAAEQARDARPFVHRSIQASEAMPLGRVGPASVWEFGT